MKSVTVELPDKLAEELDNLIKTGWFSNHTQVVHLALMEFVRHHGLFLHEQFQREDIAWALEQKGTNK
jgi:Arc/MetJ-type ribon-helix-helix transcriptional regulator